MKASRMSVGVVVFSLLFSGLVHADDIVDVKGAEIAFNAASNAGRIAELAKFFLPGRTIYGSRGGGLRLGETEENLARRQAAFDAGRKVDYRIEKLEVRVYGDTAVSTFERVGTIQEVGSAPRDSHLRITGVWVKVDGGWRLAHRHESPF